MTIPLDNLYDYIFSLTGHTNKNLAMYRFNPHGEKNIKNLIIHNAIDDIMIQLSMKKNKKTSLHFKLLFCYDQEPLNFDLYSSTYYDDERRKLFNKVEGKLNQFNNPIVRKWMRKENIAGSPHVIPTIFDKKLLLHSEKNSENLEKYEKNGFIGVYYWSHAFLSLDWYRFAKHDRLLKNNFSKPFKYDFNIYCRAWSGSREYRIKFLTLLKKYELDKKSNIIFNEYDNENHINNYVFKNKIWQIQHKEKDILSNLVHTTRNNCSEPTLSANYDSNDFQNSAIDIVLETVFDDKRIHLTEKILRPIACGKPFILVSGKGSLQYLRSYGFETFDELIDEKYDSINSPKKRLQHIIKTMKKISNLPEDEKKQLFIKMHEIAEKNKKWFFSDTFFNIINDELKKNLSSSLKLLDTPTYQTAKRLRVLYRAYKMYYRYLNSNEKEEAKDFISQVHERIELSKKNIGIS